MTGLPKPGSDEARRTGCSCPVLDNHRGRSAPLPPDGWWVASDCPLHGLGLALDEPLPPAPPPPPLS